jgi:hypothetical protein
MHLYMTTVRILESLIKGLEHDEMGDYFQFRCSDLMALVYKSDLQH